MGFVVRNKSYELKKS